MKSFKYIFIVLGIVFLFQSCLFHEEDIFDKSAPERIDEQLVNIRNILEGSTYGWKFAYDCDPTICIHFFMKFYSENNAHKVSVLSDINSSFMTNPSVSSYSYKRSQGPVISFDTKNEQLTSLAEPTLTGSTDGGDNDFVVAYASQDSVVLRGIKGGYDVVMYRANETDEAGYFVNNTRFKAFFSKTSNTPFFSELVFGDGTAISFNRETNSRYISFLYKEGDNLITQRVSFDFNGTGFNIWNPLTINGKTISHFVWDEVGQNFRPSTDSDGGFRFSHTTPFPYSNSVGKFKGKELVLSAYSSWVRTYVFSNSFNSAFRNYRGLELAYDLKGESYFSMIISAGSQDPNNYFRMSGYNELREDQISFKNAGTGEGVNYDALNSNPFFDRLKSLIFAESGLTIFEDGSAVYFIDAIDSSKWLRFTISED